MKKKFFKVLILGDAGVGKTSILEQYVNKAFTGYYKVTIGVDFLTKDLEVDESKVKLQIWDTAGSEKYRSLSIAYYRGADACVFVFDLTDKMSFRNLDNWIEAFHAQLPEDKQKNFPSMLFGNKLDKPERIVTKEQVEKWRSEHGNMPYFETSAKTRQGLDEAFEFIAKRVLKANQAEEQT